MRGWRLRLDRALRDLDVCAPVCLAFTAAPSPGHAKRRGVRRVRWLAYRICPLELAAELASTGHHAAAADMLDCHRYAWGRCVAAGRYVAVYRAHLPLVSARWLLSALVLAAERWRAGEPLWAEFPEMHPDWELEPAAPAAPRP